MGSPELVAFPPVRSASMAGRTMQESVCVWREKPRRLPDDAPNILVVLRWDPGAVRCAQRRCGSTAT